jgi:hypothetical protein
VLISSLFFNIVKIKENPGMSRSVQTFDWYCMVLKHYALTGLCLLRDVIHIQKKLAVAAVVEECLECKTGSNGPLC